MQRRKDASPIVKIGRWDGKLWRRWVLASLGVSALIVVLLASTRWLTDLGLGATVGLGQWLVLRLRGRIPIWGVGVWVVGTFLLGFVLGSYFVSADIGDDPDSHLDSYRFVVTAVASVGGLALGFLQWPTVRGRSRRAYLLVVVNAIGWAVGWTIGPIVGTVMGHNSMIALLCSWIITIALTGSGVAWLLSQRE